MAKVDTQNIPAELKDAYDATLNTQGGLASDDKVRGRIPFRIPTLQGCRTIRPPIPVGAQVTWAQCEHRHLFGRSVKCFNLQPDTGGATPPDLGPRGRDWWFNDAIGKLPWYYNWFMYETLNSYVAGSIPDWCKIVGVDTSVTDPDNPNYAGWPHTWDRIDTNGVGYFKRLWYRRVEPQVRYMTVTFSIIWNYGTSEDKILSVYQIDADPNKLFLKWNNQPPLGAKVDEIKIVDFGTGPFSYNCYTGTGQWVAMVVTAGKWGGIIHLTGNGTGQNQEFWYP